MARIKIGDLQKDMKISKDEMKTLMGGIVTPSDRTPQEGVLQRWGYMGPMGRAAKGHKYVIGDVS